MIVGTKNQTAVCSAKRFVGENAKFLFFFFLGFVFLFFFFRNTSQYRFVRHEVLYFRQLELAIVTISREQSLKLTLPYTYSKPYIIIAHTVLVYNLWTYILNDTSQSLFYTRQRLQYHRVTFSIVSFISFLYIYEEK